MKRIIFQKEKIPADLHETDIGSAADGARLSFCGTVRNNSRGREVVKIEYEIYESMAYSEISRIIDEAVSNWGISDSYVVHRHGPVFPGEASILIVITSGHRKESFRALEYIIDQIKLRAPVWKKEYYADGSEWIDGK